MALSIRSTTGRTVNNSSTTNVPGEPAGAAQGDILVGAYVWTAGSTLTSGPSGWTQLFTGASTNTLFRYWIGWIQRGSGAAATTLTISAANYNEGVITAVQGGALGIDAAPSPALAGGTLAANPPSATPTTDGDYAIEVGIQWAGYAAATGNGSAGYTQLSTINAGDDLVIAAKGPLSGLGAEDPGAMGNGSTTNDVLGMTILVQAPPALGSVFIPQRMPLGV